MSRTLRARAKHPRDVVRSAAHVHHSGRTAERDHEQPLDVVRLDAQLDASVNPGGADTTGWFRYATASPGTCNDTFGTRAPSTGTVALVSGTSWTTLSQAISGLTPATTYYVCAIVTSSVGTTFGSLVSFTTPTVPTVTTTAATSVRSSSTTLNGPANPNRAATTGYSRYGLTNPGTCTPAWPSSATAWTSADLFSPRRQVKREGSGGGMLDFSVDSDSTLFAIPEFGYNTMYNKDVSLGVSVYGNGGMNTDFEGGQLNCSPFGGPPSANGLCGMGRLGVDLMQLIVAPTVAWKLAPEHSIGVAPLFAYQRFRIQDAHLFTQLSQAPGNVTNNEYDRSTGWGVRVGYMGDFFSLLLGSSCEA